MSRDHRLAFAYNTNGFANHRLQDVISILADLGYDGIALTLDVHHLDPMRATASEVDRAGAMIRDAGLRVVVETGGRYLLDPRRKHHPGLVSRESRRLRIDVLREACRIAGRIGAGVVSVFSGAPDEGTPPARAWGWLVDGMGEVCSAAEREGVAIAFEPEPGMLVATLEGVEDLRREVGSPALGITLDVGHVPCTETHPIPDLIRRHADAIRNVHIEDIRDGVHEHLPFGEGDIDFPPVLEALREIRYEGLVGVELSRNSHDAPLQAGRAISFLRGC